MNSKEHFFQAGTFTERVEADFIQAMSKKIAGTVKRISEKGIKIKGISSIDEFSSLNECWK